MKKLLTILITLMLSVQVSAEVVTIFANTGDLASNFATVKGDANSTVSDETGELHIYDFSTSDKPEAYVYLDTPLTEGFRIDFKFRNVSTANYTEGTTERTSDGEIRFRFGNGATDPSSNSKTGLQVGFKYNGDFRYGYDNGSGGLSTSSAEGTQDIGTNYNVTIVANNSVTDSLDFNFGGMDYTLASLTYSIFIDGAEANLDILLQTGDSAYDPALGISRFGFLGDSDSKGGANVYIDDLVLLTGADAGFGGGAETWFGYPVAAGIADTGAWLGWVYVTDAPWIYNYAIEGWMHVADDSVSESGGWVYLPQ